MRTLNPRRLAPAVWTAVLLLATVGASLRPGARGNMDPSRFVDRTSGQAIADSLLKAIDTHDIDAVRIALRSGVDPNGPGTGQRVLGQAISANDPAIVRELIRAGADVNATTMDGSALTMLHLAAFSQERAIVKILLQAGAKPEARSATGLNALALAAIADANLVCEPLVHAGADINSWTLWPTNLYAGVEQTTPPKRGRTALMIAASMGHWKTVGALLALGADEKLTNERGETALTLAGEIENPIEILRSYLSNPAKLRPVRR